MLLENLQWRRKFAECTLYMLPRSQYRYPTHANIMPWKEIQLQVDIFQCARSQQLSILHKYTQTKHNNICQCYPTSRLPATFTAWNVFVCSHAVCVFVYVCVKCTFPYWCTIPWCSLMQFHSVFWVHSNKLSEYLFLSIVQNIYFWDQSNAKFVKLI